MWAIESDVVRVQIAKMGGQVGPIEFRLGDRTVKPLATAPWRGERDARSLPPVLRDMRSDFFCMPFGGNAAPYKAQRHPVHGETANADWTMLEKSRRIARLELHAHAWPARIVKEVRLFDRQPMVYFLHEIHASKDGPMSFGHHAMVDAQSPGLLSVGGFRYGLTPPLPVEQPAERGYSRLKTRQRFSRLDKVPTITGEYADISRIPSTRGWEDIVQLVTRPVDGLGWSAVVFEQQRYIYFQIKSSRLLPTTLLWMSNGGRHYAPWNGRHLNVVGVEDVCSYFHYGLAESVAPNELSRAGIPTCVELSRGQALRIPYCIGVATCPAKFGRVKNIEFDAKRGRMVLLGASGRKVACEIDLSIFDGD